jgi:RNA polymerase sigma factor (sigma-70 family)
MSFPETRHTLIQRLAGGAQSDDWQAFLGDYWGPLCRFAQRRGSLSSADAEDVAGLVFEAIVQNRLLERWTDARTARLRTLLCAVVVNVLSNRARVAAGRKRITLERGGMLDRYREPGPSETLGEQDDAFYGAWVDEVLEGAIERLLEEYTSAGKGDYFRVLYGRICDQMPVAEIAESLDIRQTNVENYYRHAREKLGTALEELVREHVKRYSPPESVLEEFAAEWERLGTFLSGTGGLEAAIRRVCEEAPQYSFRRKPPERLSQGGWKVEGRR